jgi:DNA-binding NtrC family response regulator
MLYFVPKGNENILIVDDESSILEVVETTLSILGYKVNGVLLGREAVALYEMQHNMIDLVIIDIGMPDMSGWEVSRKLLTIDPKCKIIILTGFYPLQNDIDRDMLKRIPLILPKPFAIEQLGRSVRTVLDMEPRGASYSHEQAPPLCQSLQDYIPKETISSSPSFLSFEEARRGLELFERIAVRRGLRAGNTKLPPNI